MSNTTHTLEYKSHEQRKRVAQFMRTWEFAETDDAEQLLACTPEMRRLELKGSALAGVRVRARRSFQ